MNKSFLGEDAKEKLKYLQGEKDANGLFGPELGRVRFPTRSAVDIEDASTGGHLDDSSTRARLFMWRISKII